MTPRPPTNERHGDAGAMAPVVSGQEDLETTDSLAQVSGEAESSAPMGATCVVCGRGLKS